MKILSVSVNQNCNPQKEKDLKALHSRFTIIENENERNEA